MIELKLFHNALYSKKYLCPENQTQFMQSRVAQWKRAGPITQRSVDRNYALLTRSERILDPHFSVAPVTVRFHCSHKTKFFKHLCSREYQTVFRYRESNPGLLGESQLS